MHKVGDIVVHKNGVCRVREITKNFRNSEDYYTLETIDDEPLIIRVPVSRSKKIFRAIMTKEEAESLIDRMVDVDTVNVNARMPEQTYKKLMDKGTHKALVCIMKTAKLRSRDRQKQGLKLAEKDRMYHRLAEQMLYGELSAALSMTLDDTRDYIASRIGRSFQLG